MNLHRSVADRLALQVPATLGSDILVFMHLPKTGGTAFRLALTAAYDRSARALVYGPGALEESITRDQLAGLPPDRLTDLRLVVGHVPYGIHGQLGRRCRYATLLRDPVERVVSLYYHYRNLPGLRFGSRGHRERWRLRIRRVSLEDWVFGEARSAADNFMVRSLAGLPPVAFGRCGEDMYARAVENIQRDFVAVMVTEDMARSRIVLERAIGRHLPLVGHENSNPRRPALAELSPKVVSRIRQLNDLDLRLHGAALEWLSSNAD